MEQKWTFQQSWCGFGVVEKSIEADGLTEKHLSWVSCAFLSEDPCNDTTTIERAMNKNLVFIPQKSGSMVFSHRWCIHYYFNTWWYLYRLWDVLNCKCAAGFESSSPKVVDMGLRRPKQGSGRGLSRQKPGYLTETKWRHCRSEHYLEQQTTVQVLQFCRLLKRVVSGLSSQSFSTVDFDLLVGIFPGVSQQSSSFSGYWRWPFENGIFGSVNRQGHRCQ